MFTKPGDLADATIATALAEWWSFEPVDLDYLPVGFGAHHWVAVSRTGDTRFVSVDNLVKQIATTPDGTTDAAFDRLERGVPAQLARWATMEISTSSSLLCQRSTARHSCASTIATPWSCIHSGPAHPQARRACTRRRLFRVAVLGRLVTLHAATDAAAPYAGVERGFLPGRDELTVALDRVRDSWPTGPYGERARILLREHADSVRTLVAYYDQLVVDVCTDRERMVITHGEPSASNVVIGAGGEVWLVDWESALIAPPERDLWELDPGDGSILAAYTDATGVELVEERLAFCRLWYDLFEIAGYIGLFRSPHTDTADAAESWKNLVEFLQPEARWPVVFS